MAGSEIEKTAADLAATAVGPAAKSFGNSAAEAGAVAGHLLVDITKTTAGIVKLGLLPAKALIWGWEKIEERILPKIRARIEEIAPEDRRVPPQSIVASALDAAKFVAEEDVLADMFANLIASASNEKIYESVHPAYSDVIRQISPLEGEILSLYARQKQNMDAMVEVRLGYKSTSRYSVIQRHLTTLRVGDSPMDGMQACRAIDNFERLGIIATNYVDRLADDKVYQEFERHPIVISARSGINNEQQIILHKGGWQFTEFGRGLVAVCCRDNAPRFGANETAAAP